MRDELWKDYLKEWLVSGGTNYIKSLVCQHFRWIWVPKVLSLLPMIDQVNHRSGVRSQFSRVVWNLWFPWNRSMKKCKKNQKIHSEVSFAVRLGGILLVSSYHLPSHLTHGYPWCIWGPSRFAIRSYWSCMGAASHQTVRTPSGLGTVGSWTAVKLREFGTF